MSASRALVFPLLLLLCCPAPAQARKSGGSARQAKALFKDGQKKFKAERYPEALSLFQKAHALHPHPDIVFMVGQAQRNLKYYGDAIQSFKQYLEMKPEAEDRGEVERLIEELEFLAEASGEGAGTGQAGKAGADGAEGDKAGASADKQPRQKPLAEPTAPRAPASLVPGARETPTYKKWWFWAAIGGGLVLAGGLAVGGYFIAQETGAPEAPSGSLGLLDLR